MNGDRQGGARADSAEVVSVAGSSGPPSQADASTSGLGGPYVSNAARIEVSLSEGRRVATIEVLGDLDMATQDCFESEVQAVLDSRVDHLVIDLRALAFMDLSGVRSLLKVDALSRKDGFRLWIVNNPADSVAKLLHITRLDKVLPLVDEPPRLPG